jgi:hypothetical protein
MLTRAGRALIAVLILTAASTVAAPVAAGQDTGCELWVENPPDSGIFECAVIGGGGGGGGSGGGGGGGGGGDGGTATGCFDGDQQVACATPFGTWFPPERCYISFRQPQPAHSDPAWGGRTDGGIWTCVRVLSGGLNGFGAPTSVVDLWLPAPPPGVTVDPAALAQQAVDSMLLTAIALGVAPRALSDDPASMGLVGLPVWMWTAPTATTWGPNTASASAAGVTVTATASVERVEFDMGDGTTVTCTRMTDEYHASLGPSRKSPSCGHVYQRTSAEQPGGNDAVTATSHWVADWSGGGESGTITFQLSTTERLRIGEMQVLRTE